ncbi:hypothetical protein GW17_00038445 [Ensete ventricosum]|nr:hypothetical protein GW17_00038445 [Ensete ventricosum]
MAAEETTRNNYAHFTGYDQADDLDDELSTVTTPAVYFTGHADEARCHNASQRMSGLPHESEGEDADVEPSSGDDESKGAATGGCGVLPDGTDKDEEEESSGMGVASMPGTPSRGFVGRAEWLKEYASETEARGRGRRRHHHHRRYRQTRERWLERAWQLKKSHAAAEDGSDAGAAAECRVMVQSRCGSGRMCMDMEEMRACRDLGLDLPSDWTVEIPGTFSDLTADTSSGGNSPVNWRISTPGTQQKKKKKTLSATLFSATYSYVTRHKNFIIFLMRRQLNELLAFQDSSSSSSSDEVLCCETGDDPKDVKARIKVWAQAVALTSASRLGG